MQQPEKFVCIPYPQIDFLIPSEEVVSSVGVKDLNLSLLSDQESGFFDFDEIASKFIQIPRQAEIKTMIILQGNEKARLSLLTTQECRVSILPLKNFRVFSDFYSEQFKKLGLLACSFTEDRLGILMDVKQMIRYMNDCLVEEL